MKSTEGFAEMVMEDVLTRIFAAVDSFMQTDCPSEQQIRHSDGMTLLYQQQQRFPSSKTSPDHFSRGSKLLGL